MSRRAPAVLGVTAAGLIGILSYHTHSTTLAAGRAPGSGGAPSSPASAGTGSSTTVAPGSGSGSAPAASGSSSAPAGGSSSAGAPATAAKATGPVVQFGYGQLDVSVTLSGGKITDVTVPSLQVADPTSQQIAQEVFPMLKRQVLAAQSANISGITGATYTSQAYAQSLQSALTKAKG